MLKSIDTENFNLSVNIKGSLLSKKLMLVLPGKLDSKDYAHMKSHVDYFSKKGYLTVSFDPYGSWASIANIKEYTMSNYLQSIFELIDFFGNRPTVLLGHSMGGKMALIAGTQNVSVTHIIAIMTRLERIKLTEEIKKSNGEVHLRDTPTKKKVKYVLPFSYFNDASKYNDMKEVFTCKKPKLLFYGTNDSAVPPPKVKPLFDAFSEPKEMHILKTDHDYRKNPRIISEVNRKTEKFLKKY